MKLADIDRLNILYFGEMDISAKERALRVRMAAEFEALVRKYLLALQIILASGKSEQEIQAAIAMTAVAFAREYRRFFNTWYPRYYEVASNGGESSGTEAEWRDTHSTQVSVWLANTARNSSAGSVMGRLRTDIRTEINAMCNFAMFRALADNGTPYKKWRSHHDGLTRFTHSEADEQIVPIDEPFVVGGYLMMFPLDSSLGAPAEEIVNCRCVMEGTSSPDG